MKHLILFLFLLPLGLFAQTAKKPTEKPVLGTTSTPDEVILPASDAKKVIGFTNKFCDVVVDGRYLESSTSKLTLLNLGVAFPNQELTIVISPEIRAELKIKPEEALKGKKVCVDGLVTEFKGKPQIVIKSKYDISFE